MGACSLMWCTNYVLCKVNHAETKLQKYTLNLVLCDILELVYKYKRHVEWIPQHQGTRMKGSKMKALFAVLVSITILSSEIVSFKPAKFVMGKRTIYMSCILLQKSKPFILQIPDFGLDPLACNTLKLILCLHMSFALHFLGLLVHS